MSPGFLPGDCLLVESLTYLFRAPRPGDAVVLRNPEDGPALLLKRVTAVEGDGERYVVQGDNLAPSRDSRHFGPVARAQILWRVAFTYARARPERAP